MNYPPTKQRKKAVETTVTVPAEMSDADNGEYEIVSIYLIQFNVNVLQSAANAANQWQVQP